MQLPVGRVLVVDGDEDLAALVAHALGGFGFITGTAATAEEAVGVAKALDPHVIVIDAHLGHGLAAQLRSVGRRAVQLIALTADDSQHLEDRSRALGFAAHLLKPIPIRDLVRLIGVVQLRAGSIDG